MKCATLALSAAEDDSALEVARFQKFPPFFNGGLFFAVKDAILGITQLEFRSSRRSRDGGLFFAVKDAIPSITQGTSHVDSAGMGSCHRA